MDNGKNPFAWLLAFAVGAFALALVVVGVATVLPWAIGKMLGYGDVGILLLGIITAAIFACVLMSIDAVGDGLAAMGATAGLSIRKRKAEADNMEAGADATRAATWAAPAANGVAHDYTGKDSW